MSEASYYEFRKKMNKGERGFEYTLYEYIQVDAFGAVGFTQGKQTLMIEGRDYTENYLHANNENITAIDEESYRLNSGDYHYNYETPSQVQKMPEKPDLFESFLLLLLLMTILAIIYALV